MGLWHTLFGTPDRRKTQNISKTKQHFENPRIMYIFYCYDGHLHQLLGSYSQFSNLRFLINFFLMARILTAVEGAGVVAARQEADRLRTGRLRWAQKHVILLEIYWGFALGSSLGERREDTSNVAVAGGWLWAKISIWYSNIFERKSYELRFYHNSFIVPIRV